jgi:ABC-type molybdate transport system substrate-binding protein
MRPLPACVVAVVAMSLTGCGAASSDSVDNCTLEVFAASSLSSALTEMTDDVRSETGCDVTFKFGSSGSLAASIDAGATPDVFLSSGTGSVSAAGLDVSSARALVESRLAVIAKQGSEAALTVATVDDLLDRKWKLGLCAVTAPCGELADAVLLNATNIYGDDSGFSREALADTEAINASDLLTKVEMGELDVVLGYASSCASNPDLVCTVIPDEMNGQQLGEKTTFYLTPLGDSASVAKLLGYLESTKFAQRLISDFGFEELTQ